MNEQSLCLWERDGECSKEWEQSKEKVVRDG